ncbi:hypothetical protein LCGC14_2899080 [marine sediment metagenome]|uniref:Uncharacterized protein n=1 Tax=marine sediment metagenome TaxID=412755 RepID=A0A0F8XV15_9ZZZZ
MNLNKYHEKNYVLSQEDVVGLIESYEVLEQHINTILSKVREIDKDAPYDCSESKIGIYSEHIEFEWTSEEGCRGCYDDVYHSYELPIRYLWEDIDKIVKDIAHERKVEEEYQAEMKLHAKIQRKIEKNDKRYADFLKMKEEYEGESK